MIFYLIETQERQTEREKERQTDRLVDREREGGQGQTDWQTHKLSLIHI